MKIKPNSIVYSIRMKVMPKSTVYSVRMKVRPKSFIAYMMKIRPKSCLYQDDKLAEIYSLVLG